MLEMRFLEKLVLRFCPAPEDRKSAVTLGTGAVLTSHGPLVAQGPESSIDLPRGSPDSYCPGI